MACLLDLENEIEHFANDHAQRYKNLYILHVLHIGYIKH